MPRCWQMSWLWERHGWATGSRLGVKQGYLEGLVGKSKDPKKWGREA